MNWLGVLAALAILCGAMESRAEPASGAVEEVLRRAEAQLQKKLDDCKEKLRRTLGELDRTERNISKFEDAEFLLPINPVLLFGDLISRPFASTDIFRSYDELHSQRESIINRGAEQLAELVQLQDTINRVRVLQVSASSWPSSTQRNADVNAPYRANADVRANEPAGGVKLTEQSSYVPSPSTSERPGLTTSLPLWVPIEPQRTAGNQGQASGIPPQIMAGFPGYQPGASPVDVFSTVTQWMGLPGAGCFSPWPNWLNRPGFTGSGSGYSSYPGRGGPRCPDGH